MSAVEKEHKWWVNAGAGGFGGAFSKSLMAPLQRIVVLHQLGEHPGKNSLQLAKWMVEREGYKGFWRGNLTAILIRIPYSGMQLVIFSRLKFWFQRICGISSESKQGDVMMQKFIMKCGAGGLAAGIAGAAVFPAEVVRTRLMSGDEAYRTISGTTAAIVKESPWNFYAGLSVSLMQRVPDILLNFAVYETVRAYAAEKGVGDVATIFAGGSSAALCTIAFLYPLDMAKRKMAMAGKTKDGIRFRNVWHCLSHTYKAGGWVNGLYSGAKLEAIRCVPQVVVMWLAIEGAREFLSKVDDTVE